MVATRFHLGGGNRKKIDFPFLVVFFCVLGKCVGYFLDLERAAKAPSAFHRRAAFFRRTIPEEFIFGGNLGRLLRNWDIEVGVLVATAPLQHLKRLRQIGPTETQNQSGEH